MMHEHLAIIQWKLTQDDFANNQYSRDHTWAFDGGITLAASASPHVVPLPYSSVACIDPEEAFVASLSSCHMLWFLSIAAKNNRVVEQYTDHAVGMMMKNEDGRLAITRVHLRPQISFSKESSPTAQQLEEMHQEAHHQCFLANSVKTEIVIDTIV